MSPPIRIVSPELTVPVLDAPRLKPVDVSSGLEAAAGGFDQLARARRIGEASDTQIGFTQAFSDLDNEVRAAPWDQKQALFDERADQIREQLLDPVTDPQVREAVEPEFDRTLGIYRAHTVHDAFTGETAYHLASADANADDMARRIAFARSPQERRMLVDQGATPYDNLAIMGVIDGPQRQAKIERFLNAADVYAVGQAIADPAKNPAAVAQALVDPNRYPHLDADQRDNFKLLARNEAIRRRSAAAADASVAGAATASDAANAAKADVQSRLATGRPLDPVSQDAIDALPSDRQSAYRTAAANAGKIFAAVGDMRTLSSDGIQSALETVKPLGADVHAQAQDLADGIMADRAADPANAMRASIPLVAKAWTAYAHDASPENLQAALKLSRAAQTALGIAPEDSGSAQILSRTRRARARPRCKPVSHGRN